MPLAEQPSLTFAVVLIVQCTVVTGLALLLAALRHGAAYREMVLRIGLYCALLCPVLTAGLFSSDIHWITITLPESKPPRSPSEAELRPNPGLSPPAQSTAPLIADTEPTHFIEPEPIVVPIQSTEHSFVAHDVPPEPTSDPEPVPGGMMKWIVLLWAAGLLAGLVGLSRSSVKLRRILRSARPLEDDRLQAALHQVESTLSAKRPLRVVESPHVPNPVAAGILRTTIVLPRGLLARVSADELRAILLHEGAHVIRGDHFTLLLERLLAAAGWFHPLVHLLIRRLDRAREEVCDNYVLQSVDAPSYGEALLRLMQLSSDNNNAGLAVGLFPTSWRLDERISGLLNEGRNTMVSVRKTSTVLIAVALILCALVVGLARVTAQSDTTPFEPPRDPSKSEVFTPNILVDDSIEIPAKASADEAGFYQNTPTQNLPADSSDVATSPSLEPLFRNRGASTFDEAGYGSATSIRSASNPNPHARIASVDMNRLIRSTTKFQRWTKAREQKIADADQTLQNLLEEQKSLQVALDAIPQDNKEARTALQKVVQSNALKIQQSKKTAFTGAKQDESEIYLDIYREARNAIRMYADYYKVELVLHMENKPRPRTDHPVDLEPGDEPTRAEDVLQQINRPVVYASGLDSNADKIDDITDAIIDYLNKREQRDQQLGGDAPYPTNR